MKILFDPCSSVMEQIEIAFSDSPNLRFPIFPSLVISFSRTICNAFIDNGQREEMACLSRNRYMTRVNVIGEIYSQLREQHIGIRGDLPDKRVAAE